MSNKVIPFEDRVKPARLVDQNTGDEYVLDFNRDSIRFAEARGFKPDDVLSFPATKIPELFFYAFRKNHKNYYILLPSYNAYKVALHQT